MEQLQLSGVGSSEELESILGRMKVLSSEIFLTTKHMIEFGSLAEKAKTQIPHGQFEPWLKEHFNGVSISSIRNWRKLAAAAVKNAKFVEMEPVRAMCAAGIVKQCKAKKGGAGDENDGKPSDKKTKGDDSLVKQAKSLAKALKELPGKASDTQKLFAALHELQEAISKFTQDTSTQAAA